MTSKLKFLVASSSVPLVLPTSFEQYSSGVILQQPLSMVTSRV